MTGGDTRRRLAVIGVLLGAVTSFFATSVAERATFRQTLATRWAERKLDTYIEYIACVKEAVRAARQALEAHEHDEDGSEPLSTPTTSAAVTRRTAMADSGYTYIGTP